MIRTPWKLKTQSLVKEQIVTVPWFKQAAGLTRYQISHIRDS